MGTLVSPAGVLGGVRGTELCQVEGTRCRGRPVTPRAAPIVLHSGEYFLFESDSEEEEEAAVPEEPRPGRQSAFQVGMARGWGGRLCPPAADGPLPKSARLPGLDDQHQDGAAAAGAGAAGAAGR